MKEIDAINKWFQRIEEEYGEVVGGSVRFMVLGGAVVLWVMLLLFLTRYFGAFGFFVSLTLLIFAALFHKQIFSLFKKVDDKMNKGVQFLMKKNKIAVHMGEGRLTGKGKLSVKSEDCKTAELSAKHIIVATGARARGLPFAKYLSCQCAQPATRPLALTNSTTARIQRRRRLPRRKNNAPLVSLFRSLLM
jgi:hypothetical protein